MQRSCGFYEREGVRSLPHALNDRSSCVRLEGSTGARNRSEPYHFAHPSAREGRSCTHRPSPWQSLSIQNFRGIESLDLDFRGPDGKPNQLIVLAGPNGSGKTAVLEAALLSAGGTKLITRPADHRAVRSGSDHYLVSAVLQNMRDEIKVVIGVPTPKPFQMHEVLPVWYFSSWRASSIVGPVDATVGKPSRRAAKPDQNRLFNVKQILVNAATIERFENRPPQSARYSAIMRKINNAWRRVLSR